MMFKILSKNTAVFFLFVLAACGCAGTAEPPEIPFYRLNYRIFMVRDVDKPADEKKAVAVTEKSKKAVPPPAPEKATVAEKIQTAELASKPKNPAIPYRLKGIIRKPDGLLALVEEDTSGKGYIVSDGAYIGITNILVKQVLEDRVLLEEQIRDRRGRRIVKNYELLLEKSALPSEV